ncbi:MAG: MaoC family dehydratase [Pseudomonadota bacterium]
MITVVKPADLAGHVGKETGVSEWLLVDQARINAFAECTEDFQFIHLDEERAKQTPFGGTVAHGFLTLSLLAKLAESATLALENIKMGVNYGFEKIRFVSPVRSGKRVRGRFMLKGAEEKSPGQWQLVYEVSVEIEGEDKPALVAEWLTRQYV